MTLSRPISDVELAELAERLEVDSTCPQGLRQRKGRPVGSKAKGRWITNFKHYCSDRPYRRSYVCARIILLLSKGRPPAPEMEADHIDRNPLNNRADNLRWATRSDQSFNSIKPNKTGYRWVHYCGWKYRWTLKIDGVQVYGPSVSTAAEAHRQALQKRKELGLPSLK